MIIKYNYQTCSEVRTIVSNMGSVSLKNKGRTGIEIDAYERKMEYISQNHLPYKTFQIVLAKIMGNVV